ncbi:MAG TPA: L,D-transpeptidase [Pseudolabrys sp.]|nr:L,D-transpeptidase [Pseudolabrys sp.]
MVMRRRLATLAAVLAAGLIAYAAPARAEILIHVDKSTQQMDVSLNGAPLFTWPVSTGAPGYDTPSGTFKPFRMEKKHFSKEWDNAPMPHSIFFTMKGHAIHGSYHKTIGQPVSHGCVRLEPKNAQILFDLVKQEGMASTCVVLDGVTPGARTAPLVARQGRDYGSGTYIENGAVVGAIPQQPRITGGSREYSDGPRYYYYRGQPYYLPVRRSGYEVAPAPPPPPPDYYYYGRQRESPP